MKLALFFTFGISAKLWKEKGLLERERLIYENLLERGIIDKVYWFTYGSRDKDIEKELKEGIQIVPLPQILNSGAGSILYSLILPLIHYKTLRNIDIFKTNQMSGSWTAIIAKLLFKKPLIVRTGYTWSLFAEKGDTCKAKFFVIKMLEKLACSFSDTLVVSSPNDLDYLKQNYSLDNKGEIIPNYIDTDLFKPLNEKKAEKAICFVGRLTSQKNLLSLLKALIGVPYSLSIIGSGEEMASLSTYARENHISVNFLGDIENSKLPVILNRHELFILPSLYEGTPKALLEAMSCGIPCIGTNVEGIAGIIRHKENGYICSTDPASIRRAINEVSEKKALLASMGRNARQTIIENFSLEKTIEKETSLYRALLV